MTRFDTKGAIKYYSSVDRTYSMKDAIGTDSRINIITNWIQAVVPNKSKVLDVGCGDMTLSTLLPNYQWVGYDVDTSKHPNVVQCDISQFPYPGKDEEFDAVVCSEVLEHLFEPHTAIKEFARLLQPGGKLIITVPNFDNIDMIVKGRRNLLFNPEDMWTIEHIRWYNVGNMTRLLTKQRFSLLKVTGSGCSYSKVMVDGTRALVSYLFDKYRIKLDQAEADLIHGEMYPYYSPGICFLAEKEG